MFYFFYLSNIFRKMDVIKYAILFITIWNQMSAEMAQRLSKLNESSQKPLLEITNNLDAKELKRDWHKDFNNTDKFNCNSTMINRRNSEIQSEKRYRQSTEPVRELKKSNEDCHFGTHLLIRLFSIDYKMPVLNSDSEINPVITVILYSAVVMIGITICIVIYWKYGFDIKEHRCTININRQTQKHLTNNAVLGTSRPKTATIKTFLIDDRPPSYGACVV